MTAKQMTANTQNRKSGELLRKPPGKAEKSPWEFAGIREWQAELSISRLFRTSIRLQTAFDRCFSNGVRFDVLVATYTMLLSLLPTLASYLVPLGRWPERIRRAWLHATCLTWPSGTTTSSTATALSGVLASRRSTWQTRPRFTTFFRRSAGHTT